MELTGTIDKHKFKLKEEGERVLVECNQPSYREMLLSLHGEVYEFSTGRTLSSSVKESIMSAYYLIGKLDGEGFQVSFEKAPSIDFVEGRVY